MAGPALTALWRGQLNGLFRRASRGRQVPAKLYTAGKLRLRGVRVGGACRSRRVPVCGRRHRGPMHPPPPSPSLCARLSPCVPLPLSLCPFLSLCARLPLSLSVPVSLSLSLPRLSLCAFRRPGPGGLGGLDTQDLRKILEYTEHNSPWSLSVCAFRRRLPHAGMVGRFFDSKELTK